ncbi:MAG: hypothetical protein JWO06_1985, partial [Bacteroidota bacterium]|nr:hypothetical protein [Bacteroidota bacterium]
KNPSGLIWIDKDNIKLFEVISDRKTLSNTPQDNWILPFNSSIDVKDRLSIELRTEMKQIRLDRLIESGNLPFLTVWGDAIDIPNSLDVRLNLEVTNVGNQVAIGPLLVLFRAKDYQEVLRDNLYMDPTSSNVKNFNSLLPSGTFKLPTLPIKVDKLNDEVHLVASVLYKTIHGDLLTDVTEISIKTVLRPKMKMAIRYTTKHYLQEDTYEKIIAK